MSEEGVHLEKIVQLQRCIHNAFLEHKEDFVMGVDGVIGDGMILMC